MTATMIVLSMRYTQKTLRVGFLVSLVQGCVGRPEASFALAGCFNSKGILLPFPTILDFDKGTQQRKRPKGHHYGTLDLMHSDIGFLSLLILGIRCPFPEPVSTLRENFLLPSGAGGDGGSGGGNRGICGNGGGDP